MSSTSSSRRRRQHGDFDYSATAGPNSESPAGLGNIVITNTAYMISWDATKRVEVAVLHPIDEYKRVLSASTIRDR